MTMVPSQFPISSTFLQIFFSLPPLPTSPSTHHRPSLPFQLELGSGICVFDKRARLDGNFVVVRQQARVSRELFLRMLQAPQLSIDFPLQHAAKLVGGRRAICLWEGR